MSRAKRGRRIFTSPDGTPWLIEVRSPGASNAMIVFRHPDGATTRRNRYAWVNWHGPEARNVTARLEGADVLASVDDAALELLFRRSMPVDGFGKSASHEGRPPGLGSLGKRTA